MSSRLIRLLLKLYPESRRDRRCAPPAVAAAGIPPVIPEGCDSLQRVHISPRLGARPVSQVKTAHVEALATSMLNAGRAPKTVRNVLTFLHSVFELAHDRGLVSENPVRRATRPARRRKGDANPDLQFLTVEELDAVIRAIADKIVVRKPRPTRRGKICPGPSPPPDVLGPVLRVLVRAAAMTGLRQSERLGWRRRDVDWSVQRIRVCSRNGSRSTIEHRPQSAISALERPREASWTSCASRGQGDFSRRSAWSSQAAFRPSTVGRRSRLRDAAVRQTGTARAPSPAEA